MLDSDFSPGKDGIPTALTERVTFRGRDAVLLVLGLAVVLVNGDLVVGATSTLARAAGIPDSVIGGTIVAAGTSTPEFAVSLVANRQGRLGVFVGNIVGSNVFNVLGVLGVAAVIQPLSFESVAWHIVVTVHGRGAVDGPTALVAGGSVVRCLGGRTVGPGTTGAGRMRDPRLY